jgi:hypothetical protein
VNHIIQTEFVQAQTNRQLTFGDEDVLQLHYTQKKYESKQIGINEQDSLNVTNLGIQDMRLPALGQAGHAAGRLGHSAAVVQLPVPGLVRSERRQSCAWPLPA